MDGGIKRTVNHGRNFRVRIHLDETAAELVASVDADHPGIVFRPRVSGGEQLLKQYCDFHSVRRAHGIELQRMVADRQRLVMRSAGHRTVDAGESAPAGSIPDPHARRNIAGRLILVGSAFSHILIPGVLSQ